MLDFTSIGKEMIDIAKIRGRRFKKARLKVLSRLNNLSAKESALLREKTEMEPISEKT